MMQQCGRCREEKSCLDFAPSRRGKVGYPCRSCVAKESRDRKTSFGTESEYRCGRCREVKPGSLFTPSRRTNGGYCKSCGAEVAKESREKSGPAGVLERRCNKYGITVGQFNEMVLAQLGRCGICGEFGFEDLHIDHDEGTGQVRGLLCGNCNRGIGCLKHDTSRLISAVEYLQKESYMLETEKI